MSFPQESKFEELLNDVEKELTSQNISENDPQISWILLSDPAMTQIVSYWVWQLTQ